MFSVYLRRSEPQILLSCVSGSSLVGPWLRLQASIAVGWVRSLVRELRSHIAVWYSQKKVYPFTLEKGMATHSSIPAWEIPWTEEPGSVYRIAKSWT